MPSILIPPDRPNPLPPNSKEDGQLALWNSNDFPDIDLTPHLLIQLQDDIERSRMREAFWISVVVHMALVIFLVMSPTLFPGIKGVALLSPADIMRNQQLTYLDLPPDAQKPRKASPEAKVLSDKNRIAESRHPSLDKKTLEELKRAGPPGPASQPGQTAQLSPPMQQGAQQPSQSQNQPMAQLQPIPDPKLPMPSQGNSQSPVNFADLMKSPGDLTTQAARAAIAARRGGGTYGGGGDYGAGPGGSARNFGNLDIISDTQGVDFGPYLQRVLDAVRRNWYTLIPEEARAPLMKRGRLAIEFVILPDGTIAGMKLVAPSGDVSLDRAAWGGITGSNPFAPLPSEFHGPYLGLRFRFYYNPQKGDMD